MGVTMNPVWLHLLVNHIPIIATSLAVLVVAVGFIVKNNTIKQVGLVLYVVTGLTVYAANFTGEPAEDKIEHIDGISKKQIHAHEEAAELMVTLTSIALALALLHLFNRPSNTAVQRWVLIAFLVVGVGASVQGVITGHEGGLIRRPDLGGLPATPAPVK